MRNRFSNIGMFLLIAVFASGCEETSTATLLGTDSPEFAPALASAAIQSSNLYEFPPPMVGEPVQIEGATASLVRNRNGVRLNVRTRELEPGHAYTVWWVIFDAPENCGVPFVCGLADLFAEGNPSESSVFGPAAGSLAGGTGGATFAGQTKPGDEANDVLLGDGSLDNPMTAEVHFVVRGHGPAIPGMVREQISTLNGGCDPGPNECDDVQFGIFR